jgi:hypothetical protein
MDSLSEIVKKLKRGCRIPPPLEVGKDVKFENLFDKDWEVFVVKKDEKTGEFVSKLICCANAPA